MTRRGFTAIEIAIVLSISMLLIPATFAWGRSLERQRAVGFWELEVADQTRTLGEALRADRRSHHFTDPNALALEGGCGPVDYAVTAVHSVIRHAELPCRGPLTLATHVEALKRVKGGVEVTFSFVNRQHVVFIAVED